MITLISNSVDLTTKLNIVAKLESKFNISIILNFEEKEKKLVKKIT